LTTETTGEEHNDAARSPAAASEEVAEQAPPNKASHEFQRRALSALKRARTFSADDAEAGMDREVLLVQAQVYAMLSISSALAPESRQG
jgi:hypothetical protein